MAFKISSKNEAIANVVINKVPTGRKIKVKSMAARADMVIILSERGKLYAHGLWKYNETIPIDHRDIFLLLSCLRDLEIITMSDRDDHLRQVEKLSEYRSRRYNKMLLLNGAKRLGIKLTKAQEKQLAKIK